MSWLQPNPIEFVLMRALASATPPAAPAPAAPAPGRAAPLSDQFERCTCGGEGRCLHCTGDIWDYPADPETEAAR
jgi:hypothetical protein